MLASLLALGCAATPGQCDAPMDCEEGLACVLLAADAAQGQCVPVVEGELPPRTPLWSPLHPDADIDVLIVVDDSPAMAGRQAAIAAANDGLVDGLLAIDDAYVRIGVTTTSAGNPNCETTDDGKLLMHSCREHLEDFVDDEAALDVSAACTEACGLAEIPVLATNTNSDGEKRVRPWIEAIYGTSNLAEGTDVKEALRCAVLQGIGGCRYTSPLKAVQRALGRSENQPDPAFGFRRDEAYLAILVLSAGNDCSVAPGHSDIFVDNPAFWGDLAPPDLSPAICWRAGVVCEGPGPVYADCVPANLRADGEPGAPEDAVLVPVSDVAQAVRATLHPEYGLPTGAAVMAIGGVPTDAAQKVPYADAADPAFQAEHGVGPGCEADDMRAPPPVRLGAFAAEFPFAEQGSRASVCSDELTGVADFTAGIAAFIRPGCVDACSSADPVVCEVITLNDEIPNRTVPACVREGDEWVGPSGSPRCYVVRTGEDLPRQCNTQAALEIVTEEPDAPNIFYAYDCPPCPE